jgi:hypothetical protein
MGGRPSIGLEKFVRVTCGGKLKNNIKVTCICCKGEGERSFYTTRAKDHFLSCRVFQSKFAGRKLELLGKTSIISAHEAERSHRSREKTRLVVPICGGERPSMVTTTAAYLNQMEQIDRYFSEIKSDKKAKMDYEFANARIKGGPPFSLRTSREWDPFGKAAFGVAWVPPHRNIVSSRFLMESYDSHEAHVQAALRSAPAVFFSVDGFPDVNCRSVFHVLAGAPVPLALESFRVDGDPESARKLHKILKRLVFGARERLGALQTVGFGICTDSPNVMILTRKFLSGERAVDDGAEPELSIVFCTRLYLPCFGKCGEGRAEAKAPTRHL